MFVGLLQTFAGPPQQMLISAGTIVKIAARSGQVAAQFIQASCVAPHLREPMFSDIYSYAPSNLKAIVRLGDDRESTLAEAIKAGWIEIRGRDRDYKTLEFINKAGVDVQIEFKEHAILASDASQQETLDALQAHYAGHDKEDAWDTRRNWEREKAGYAGEKGVKRFEERYGRSAKLVLDSKMDSRMEACEFIQVGLDAQSERVIMVENLRSESQPLFRVSDAATGEPILINGKPFETDDLTAVRDYVRQENNSDRGKIDYVWLRDFEAAERKGAATTFLQSSVSPIASESFFAPDSTVRKITTAEPVNGEWKSDVVFDGFGSPVLRITARVVEAVKTATESIRGLFSASPDSENSIWKAAKTARRAVQRTGIDRPNLKMAFIDEFGHSQFVLSPDVLEHENFSYELNAMANSLRIAANN